MGGAFSLVPVSGDGHPSTAPWVGRGRLTRHHTEYGQSGRRVQMKKPAGAGRVSPNADIRYPPVRLRHGLLRGIRCKRLFYKTSAAA